jgi:hypothetical protein
MYTTYFSLIAHLKVNNFFYKVGTTRQELLLHSICKETKSEQQPKLNVGVKMYYKAEIFK